MPVVFVVDPKLPKDVNTIALSYTFFEVAGPGELGGHEDRRCTTREDGAVRA